MSAEIVPFGKYRGQPVEVLAADADYCEWLTAQPWFKARYLNVYNTVVNYGAEPQDSPEHNQMQAQFLADQWCFALADLLHPRRKGAYGLQAARKLLAADPHYETFQGCCELEEDDAEAPARFEDKGWDVTYAINPASITAHRTKLVPPLPACTCTCDHAADCPGNATCHGGADPYYCRHRDHERRGIAAGGHCRNDCYWSGEGPLGSHWHYGGPETPRHWLEAQQHFYQPSYEGRILAELKPDLGDDYPSVLRQVSNYPHNYGDKRCVIARRHAFQAVTWEQVVKIFAASQIKLLAENDINAAREPRCGAA